MRVFISHKKEDSSTAQKIYRSLREKDISAYLDVLDSSIVSDGQVLTEHIKQELKDCTDILVVMSESTRYSQWVPFRVGMSAQINMPTVTYLQENVELPEFLSFWPRLKKLSDLNDYIDVKRKLFKNRRELLLESYKSHDYIEETHYFYKQLKLKLGQQ